MGSFTSVFTKLLKSRVSGSIQIIVDPDPDPGVPKTYGSYGSETLLGKNELMRCRLWELVERKEESRTPVSLDQLDLDPRTGETAAHSGQVLSLTTPAGNKVSRFSQGSRIMTLDPIRFRILLLYKAKYKSQYE
jgi:hypothetical protein